jgi:hypothetical protein
MELKIDSERVKSAMERCPQAKAILGEIFPELLEKPFSFYHCGQRFFDVERCNSEKGHVDFSDEKYIYILAHSHEERTYNLINLKTGYNKNRGRHFRRVGNKGVMITKEALSGMVAT